MDVSLLMKPHHVPLVRSYQKTATRRDWDPNYPRPRVGSVRMIVTEMFTPREAADCWVRIHDVYKQPLGEMDEEDARREGGYTLAEFRDEWRSINGSWDPELVVDVVDMEYLGREPPREDAVSSVDYLSGLVRSEGRLALKLDKPESTGWAWWTPHDGFEMHAEQDDGPLGAGGGFDYFDVRRWAADDETELSMFARRPADETMEGVS